MRADVARKRIESAFGTRHAAARPPERIPVLAKIFLSKNFGQKERPKYWPSSGIEREPRRPPDRIGFRDGTCASHARQKGFQFWPIFSRKNCARKKATAWPASGIEAIASVLQQQNGSSRLSGQDARGARLLERIPALPFFQKIMSERKPPAWLASGIEARASVLQQQNRIEPAFEDGRATARAA